MHTGGCLCGAVRYAAGDDPVDTGYCHCSLCQKSTGAPLLAWASFPIGSFVYSTGTPTIYASSTRGQREFCSLCGTQICYRDSNNAETVDVNVGSLDDPAACPPRCHLFTRSQLPWLQLDDQLPRYQTSPDHEGD